MKKNAFTLVELLAVIAILTIIMVISVPQLITSIKNKKTDALEKTKDLLISAARNYVIDYELKAPTSISIETLCKNDYLECPIKNPIDNSNLNGYVNVDDNKVYVYSDTRDYITIRDYIIELYNNEETRIRDGLKKDNTPDQNIRYYGSNPNNYVSFNNELWRIIGVFGNNVKLVRSEKLGNLSWDSSESSINSGWGVNEWGESTYEDGTTYDGSDLMQYLNKMYYGGDTTITCYGGYRNETTTCPTNKLDNTAKSLIDYHTWNTGAPNHNELYNSTTQSYDTVEFYKAERGTVNGKICTSGTGCNDTVTRKTEWTGYIGLPYVTDWAYASSESACETNMYAGYNATASSDDEAIANMACKKNNWMHHGTTTDIEDATWFMSPFATPDNASPVWVVLGVGNAGGGHAANPLSAFPTIYLKSNILIESGTGTSSNPYILKAGS